MRTTESQTCPTCGQLCWIEGDEEGTCHLEPMRGSDNDQQLRAVFTIRDQNDRATRLLVEYLASWLPSLPPSVAALVDDVKRGRRLNPSAVDRVLEGVRRPDDLLPAGIPTY